MAHSTDIQAKLNTILYSRWHYGHVWFLCSTLLLVGKGWAKKTLLVGKANLKSKEMEIVAHHSQKQGKERNQYMHHPS